MILRGTVIHHRHTKIVDVFPFTIFLCECSPQHELVFALYLVRLNSLKRSIYHRVSVKCIDGSQTVEMARHDLLLHINLMNLDMIKSVRLCYQTDADR